MASAQQAWAQAAVTRGWHPYLGASIAVGAADVEEGSNDVGLTGEAVAGLRWRPGIGVGVRLIDWTRPNLLSSGSWDATTVTGFLSYNPDVMRYVDFIGGLGYSRLHRNCSTCPGLTFDETVGETGLEFHVPLLYKNTEARLFGLREWRLNATAHGQAFEDVSLQQWYIGLGVLYRWK